MRKVGPGVVVGSLGMGSGYSGGACIPPPSVVQYHSEEKEIEAFTSFASITATLDAAFHAFT